METNKISTKNFIENFMLGDMSYNILSDSWIARIKTENYNIFTFYFVYKTHLKSINQGLEESYNFLEAQYFVYHEHNVIEEDINEVIKNLYEEKHRWNYLKDLRFKETERRIKIITPIVVAIIGIVVAIINSL